MKKIKHNENIKKDFSIFCWNIANPSIKRAYNQVKWLNKRNEDIFVLTETKNSDGCLFIENYFKNHNYDVIFQKPEGKEYAVMIISKQNLKPSKFFDSIGSLRSRVASTRLLLNGKFVEIIGTYIPSRDKSSQKIKRKKQFIVNLKKSFESNNKYKNRIFCGDFNILEPSHNPHYSFFENWEYDFYNSLKSYGLYDSFRHLNKNKKEYSWVGRTGNGYRYDHCFISDDLLFAVKKCYYLHEPRKKRLSDHSAIITNFKI